MSSGTIPVVDFTACGLQSQALSKGGPYGDVVRVLVEKVGAAFKDYGFVYLTNHGVDNKLLERLTSLSNAFFQLPPERKQCCKRQQEIGNEGWVSMEMEHIDPSKPGDLKEAYNFTSRGNNIWSSSVNSDVPGFFDVNETFYKACTALALRIMKVMGIALKPENDEYFMDTHRYMGDTTKNQTTLRSLYYPPIKQEPEPGQVRLGEHSDYGSITLLFQDNVGGLEIRNRSGEFIPATPVPGAVLVNLGDLMQRWTADQLLAVKHRVLIPENEVINRQIRRSTVFFCHPDDDVMITCLDGSQKYEDITSMDYLLQKLSASYK